MLKKIKLTVLFSIFSSIANADVQFSASVSDKNITVEDTVVYSLTISGDKIDELHPKLPDLKDFEVLRSSVQSASSSKYINGKFTYDKKNIYQYELAPQKAGKLKIGKAILETPGGKLESPEVTVTVSSAGAGQGHSGSQSQRKQPAPAPADPFGDEEDDIFSQILRNRGFTLNPGGGAKSAPQMDKNAFFISVEVNKKRAYVGEQIIATWYLYTSGQLREFDALKYPELTGFWKEDLQSTSGQIQFDEEVIKGVPYKRALLVSYALFPLSAGRKNIGPFKAKATVIGGGAGGLGVFGFGRSYTFTKASQEMPVEVLPLPTQGRPSSFSGAVGQFTVSGSLSASSVKVNQPVSLKLRFQGQGNVKSIELPPLNLPGQLELYDTKTDSQYKKSGEGYKEFEVLIIPRAVGEITIPSIAMSFFDPAKAKYVLKNTPEFKLQVLQGDGTTSDLPRLGSQTSPQSGSGAPVEQGTRELRYLKTQKSLLAFDKKTMWTIWIILLLGPFCVFGFFWQRLRKQDSDAQGRSAREKAKEKLKKAKQLVASGDHRSAGVELVNALNSVLSSLVGSETHSLTIDELLESNKTLTTEKKSQIKSLASQCEVLSFAPAELAQGKESAEKLLKEVEETLSLLMATL